MSINLKKNRAVIIAFVVLAIATVAFISMNQFATKGAWVGPGNNIPPNGNVAAPLNAGTTLLQSTGGPLNVNGNLGSIGTGADRILYLGEPAVAGKWGALRWDNTSSSLKIVAGTGAPAYNQVTIQSGGNVGIGTTSPVDKIHVSSATANSRIRLTNSVTGGTSTDGLTMETASLDGYIWNYENGSIFFGTNNAQRMILTEAGNVGIGTTAPKSKLQVVGFLEYPDNAAAIAAGLTVGAFYRTGDILKVVH